MIKRLPNLGFASREDDAETLKSLTAGFLSSIFVTSISVQSACIRPDHPSNRHHRRVAHWPTNELPTQRLARRHQTAMVQSSALSCCRRDIANNHLCGFLILRIKTGMDGLNRCTLGASLAPRVHCSAFRDSPLPHAGLRLRDESSQRFLKS